MSATPDQLRNWLREGATLKRLVGDDYMGGYSVGVIDQPLGILLRVQAKDTSTFPTSMELYGVTLPVTVVGGYVPPDTLVRLGNFLDKNT